MEAFHSSSSQHGFLICVDDGTVLHNVCCTLHTYQECCNIESILAVKVQIFTLTRDQMIVVMADRIRDPIRATCRLLAKT